MISFAAWQQSSQRPRDRRAHLTEDDPSQMTLGIKGHSAAFTSGSLSPTIVVSI